MLLRLPTNGIVGQDLPSRGQLVPQTLEDDALMFLQTPHNNLKKGDTHVEPKFLGIWHLDWGEI